MVHAENVAKNSILDRKIIPYKNNLQNTSKSLPRKIICNIGVDFTHDNILGLSTIICFKFHKLYLISIDAFFLTEGLYRDRKDSKSIDPMLYPYFKKLICISFFYRQASSITLLSPIHNSF